MTTSKLISNRICKYYTINCKEVKLCSKFKCIENKGVTLLLVELGLYQNVIVWNKCITIAQFFF